MNYIKKNVNPNEITKKYSFNKLVNSEKSSWFITIGFFIIMLVITTIHHPHWVESEADGLYYLFVHLEHIGQLTYGVA